VAPVLALVKRPTALTDSKQPLCTLVHRLVDCALATLALDWAEGIATALALVAVPPPEDKIHYRRVYLVWSSENQRSS
jgi:hypothetical protein